MIATEHETSKRPGRASNCILRIDTIKGDFNKFSAVLLMDDGDEVTITVTARQLVAYRSFQIAALEQAGIVFGDRVYERRGGAGYWREEVQRALEAGK